MIAELPVIQDAAAGVRVFALIDVRGLAVCSVRDAKSHAVEAAAQIAVAAAVCAAEGVKAAVKAVQAVPAHVNLIVRGAVHVAETVLVIVRLDASAVLVIVKAAAAVPACRHARMDVAEIVREGAMVLAKIRQFIYRR